MIRKFCSTEDSECRLLERRPGERERRPGERERRPGERERWPGECLCNWRKV